MPFEIWIKLGRGKNDDENQKMVNQRRFIKDGGWARDGLIDEQIAHNMGVTRVTIHNWRQKHPINGPSDT